ncbi:HET-domain-containing protein [Gyrodon lividus]|nr:HET-domain-containing protein [Gyrodon lividus]
MILLRKFLRPPAPPSPSPDLDSNPMLAALLSPTESPPLPPLSSHTSPQPKIDGAAPPWRRLLLDTFARYIFDELPTRLLHTTTMQLVSRDIMQETFLPEVEQITEAEFKAYVQSWEIPARAFLVEGEVRSMIRIRIKYAILSHKWGSKEPLFNDMSGTSGRRRGKKASFSEGPGFQKLLRFCEKARSDYGCVYVWSDTCCIDKTSSAELDEAIRSMFRWYRNAEVCIAYLAESSTMEDFDSEPWFTRGWTLQELLAPLAIRFYNKDWQPFCPHWLRSVNDKQNTEMQGVIERVTRIPRKDLQQFQPGCGRVYEKMVWASKRHTTRGEDIAYSLIGIFDVSMPIAYGEGSWAFYRLMEVIAQRSSDRGFFAWSGTHSLYSLALPSSPSCYGTNPRLWDFRDELSWDMPFTWTKEGLQLELLVVEVEMIAPFRSEGTLDILSTAIGNWLEMTPVTFSPKWSSRCGLPGEVLSASTSPRELDLCRTWAVGIPYGYERVADEDGRPAGVLGGAKDYFCLLLGQPRNNLRWVKLETREAHIFHCEQAVREPLVTVCLQHRHLTYDLTV